MNTAVASVLADVTRRVGLGSDLFRYVRHEFYSANKDFDLHDRNGRWVLRARGGVMEFVMDDGHVRGAATHPVRDASDAVPAADGVLGVVRRLALYSGDYRAYVSLDGTLAHIEVKDEDSADGASVAWAVSCAADHEFATVLAAVARAPSDGAGAATDFGAPPEGPPARARAGAAPGGPARRRGEGGRRLPRGRGRARAPPPRRARRRRV